MSQDPTLQIPAAPDPVAQSPQTGLPSLSDVPEMSDRPAPREHTLSVRLLWSSVALSLVAGALSAMTLDPVLDRLVTEEDKALVDGSQAILKTVFAFAVVFGAAIISFFILFWRKGRNWARIVLTVLGVLSLLNLPNAVSALRTQPLTSILDILYLGLFTAGVVLSWNKGVSAWVTGRKPVPTGR